MQLAEQMLAESGSLETLSRVSAVELAQMKGVGRAKAVQIAAGFALGARLGRTPALDQILDHPSKVYQLLGEEMRLLPQESVRVVLLNTKLRLQGIQEVSRGTLDSVIAHPREVFGAAIARRAYALILVHNHPSGDPSPSMADHQLTTQLKKGAELLEIRFFDHVIVGAPRGPEQAPYYSFKENGYL